MDDFKVGGIVGGIRRVFFAAELFPVLARPGVSRLCRLLLLVWTFVLGGGNVLGVKAAFTLLADSLLGFCAFGDFHKLFERGCLRVKALFNHEGLVFFRSLGGQDIHDVFVREFLGVVEVRRQFSEMLV
jgi:hypothetical protein